jgi:hypothetical protein
MSFLRDKFPNAITFLYLPTNRSARNTTTFVSSPRTFIPIPDQAKRCLSSSPKHYVKELDGAIDIWDTGPLGYDINRANENASADENTGSITAGVQQPVRSLSTLPATDPRATIWACFKHGIDNYFYWHGVHWQHNRQKVGRAQAECLGQSDYVR